MLKKNITLFILTTFALSFFFFGSTASAQTAIVFSSQTETVPLEDGDYLETTIINTPTIPLGVSLLSTKKNITKTNISKYKNKDSTVLWSVSIKATFTYNGSTAKCISCSHSTTFPAKTWKIKSVSSSKSGNSATATAIATQSFGNISKDFTKSVPISCSKNGTVS